MIKNYGNRSCFRQLQLLSLLQKGKGYTVRSLAERFEVHERTVYRDLDLLRCAGFEVISSKKKGYFIENPVLSADSLSQEELRAIQAMASYVLRLPQFPLAIPLKSALEKIFRSVYSGIQGRVREDLDPMSPAIPFPGQVGDFSGKSVLEA